MTNELGTTIEDIERKAAQKNDAIRNVNTLSDILILNPFLPDPTRKLVESSRDQILSVLKGE